MEEAKSKKGGRPPKAALDRKSLKIELKLTPADFAKLEQQYQNADYRNRSDMYYDMLFHQSLKQRDSGTLFILKEIQDLTREIKAIGAQYSQLVRTVAALPTTGALPPVLQELIALTSQLQEKEREMFGIIIRLREKWLHE